MTNPKIAELGKAHQFKAGVSPNPGGKPKGSRNSLQGKFFKELAEDFEKHGKQAIIDTRTNSPAQYLKVVASLMPKEFEIKRPLEELSDEDIIAGVAALQSYLANASNDAGASNKAEPKQAKDLSSVH
jgi:Family of unknown function (DUF5681)